MTPNSSNRLIVFLCHSSQDKPFVHKLSQKLHKAGFETWLDEEKLLPGQDWDIEIRKALRKADVILICLSNNSVTKTGYVQKEIKLALDLADERPEGEIFLIPGLIEPCTVPSRLKGVQYSELYNSAGYAKLIETLKIKATKLDKFIAIDTNRERETTDSFQAKKIFGKAFAKIFWEQFSELKLKSSKVFTVSLIGAVGTGKTSFAYLFTEQEFNFLETGFFRSSRKSLPYDHKVRFRDNIFIIDHGAYDNSLEDNDRWNNTLKYVRKHTDLIFLFTLPQPRFGLEEKYNFNKLVEMNIPLAIVLNKIDHLKTVELKRSIDQVQRTMNQVPLPISIVQGSNIDLVKKFIFQGKNFYS